MRTEITLLSILLAGVIGKLAINLPGASILIILSGGTLAMLYFAFAFYLFSDKSLKRQSLALSIIGGIVLSIASAGLTFKFMLWPGGTAALSAAVLGIALLLVSLLVLNKKGKDEQLRTYYKNYLLRLEVWAALAVIFLSLSGQQILEIQYRNDPELLQAEVKILEAQMDGASEQQLENYYLQRDSIESAAANDVSYKNN